MTAFNNMPKPEYGDHMIELSDFELKQRKFTKKDEKDAILQRKELSLPVKGTINLVNKNTGEVVSSKRTTLMRIPVITNRGTFIRPGGEYTMAFQKRLLPGVYTRKTNAGEYESFIKTKAGTGFNFIMDPESGELSFKIYNSKTPAYAVLRGVGLTDDEIRETIGDGLFQSNRVDQYEKHIPKLWQKVTRGRKESLNPLLDLPNEFNNMELDEETTKRTLGAPHKNVTKDVMRLAVANLIKTYKGERDIDDKDSYAFQQIYGPEDYISEGIMRDKSGVLRKILYKAQNTKNLDHVPPNLFSPVTDFVFNASRLANSPEEPNALDAIDGNLKITGMGEGGFSSTQGIPDTSRLVSESQVGFVDGVRTQAAGTVGIEGRLAHNTYKGADGKLYAKMYNTKGEETYLSSAAAGDHVIAFPGEMEKVAAGKQKNVRAVNKGKLDYVTPEEVTYIIPSGQDMFSLNTNLIPYMSGIKGGRSVMGCLHPESRIQIKRKDGSFYTGTIEEYDVQHGDTAASLIQDGSIVWEPVRNKVPNFQQHPMVSVTLETNHTLTTTVNHKWVTHKWVTQGLETIRADELVVGTIVPVSTTDGILWTAVKELSPSPALPVTYDLDLNDNTFIANGIVVHNSKYSITGDTLILIQRKDGTLLNIPIQDYVYKSGDTSVSLDKATNKVSWLPVRKVSSHQNTCRMFEVTTTSGKTIKATEHHSFVKYVTRYAGTTTHFRELVEAYTETLAQGDALPTVTNLQLPEKDTLLEITLPNQDTVLLTEDVALGCGAVLAFSRNTLSVAAIKHITNRRPGKDSDTILAFFESLGLCKRAGRVPVLESVYAWLSDNALGLILNSKRSVREAFIRGAFEWSRSTFRSRAVKTPDVAVRVVTIASSLGIKAKISKGTIINIHSRVDNGHRITKQGAKDKWIESGLDLESVESVVEIPQEPYPVVYDIHMDDNLFWCSGGVLVHNTNQALSLPDREVPWVQPITDSGESFHRIAGGKAGAITADQPGTVISTSPDEIKVKYADGTVDKIELYNNLPLNRKSLYSQIPNVKTGDVFTKGQTLADSGFTKDGVLALGTHLKSAYMSFKGMTHEDSSVISESAAKKLKSEHMYTEKLDLDPNVSTDVGQFMSIFGGEYKKDKLANLDETGVIKPGSVVRKGDPMIINMSRRTNKGEGMIGGGKAMQWKDNTVEWEHDDEGVVTDVWNDGSGIKVAVKSIVPMKVGDKLCFTEDHDVYTNRGWVKVEDVTVLDKCLSLDLDTLSLQETQVIATHRYPCDERLFTINHPEITTQVTLKHKLPVSFDGSSFQLCEARDLLKMGDFWMLPGSSAFPVFISVEEHVTIEPGQGFVYCPTLDRIHTLLVRHGGKAHWSGNSGSFGNKGLIGCYPTTCDVFTDSGWKTWGSVNDKDKFACLVDGKTSFEKPLQLFEYDYNGDMLHAENKRGLNYTVTPNHRMYVRKEGTGVYYWETAEEGFKKRRLHMASVPEFTLDGMPSAAIDVDPFLSSPNPKKHNTVFDSLDFMEFLGWFLSEGYLITTPYKAVRICQCERVNPDSVRRIDKLLKRMRLTYSYSAGSKKFTIYNTPLWFLLKDSNGSSNKYIPEWVFQRNSIPELKRLFESLMLGDGHVNSKDAIEYATISEQLAKDFDRLTTILGYNTKITHSTLKGVRDRGHYDLYRVRSSRKNHELNQRDGKTEFSIIQNDSGKVYCAEVPGNLLLVRNGNGRPMWCGNSILPDDQMPKDMNGEPFELLVNPYGTVGRHNPSQIADALLSKISKKTGKGYELPAFSEGNILDFVSDELAKNGLTSNEDIMLPEGRVAKNILTGNGYYMKLHHLAESKESSVDEGAHNMSGVPTTEIGGDKPKRVGTLDVDALLAHGATNIIKDTKLVRGQENSEYFRDIMEGKFPQMPTVSPVYNKFMATLQSSGIRVTPTNNNKSLQLSAMTDADVDKISSGEIKLGDTVKWKSTYSRDLRGDADLSPVSGGLFDRGITGGMGGNRFAHIQMPAKLPQPVYEKPIRVMLGLTENQLHAVIAGKEKLGAFGTGPKAIEGALGAINVDTALDSAVAQYNATDKPSVKDKFAKRIKALKGVKNMGITPKDLMVSKVLVIPPVFRPISVSTDFEIVSDANMLYKDLLDSVDNYNQIKDVAGDEMAGESLETVYNAYRAVTGLGDPVKKERIDKHVQGLLKEVFGPSGNKTGIVQRNLIGTPAAYSARGVIVPGPDLSMDEIGLPEDMAWDTFKPFVVRRLIQGTSGSPEEKKKAMKDWEEKSPRAKDALLKEMSERPVMYSRAPVLHKYGVLAGYAKLVPGKAIRTNIPTMPGLNADIDGDTFTVHALITPKAIDDAKNKLLPSRHLFSTNDFNLMHKPGHEFNMGLYLLGKKGQKGGRLVQDKVFNSPKAVMEAYSRGEIGLSDEIIVNDKKD